MELSRMILLLSVLVTAAFGAPTCGRLYQAYRGDTCQSISLSSNLTLQEFLYLNPRINCTGLTKGEQLCTSPCFRANTSSSSPGARPVLMDYIGAMGNDMKLTDVPIAENLDHYLILSFAIDANRSGVVQNGSFIKYWSEALTPESVSAVKTKYPNVRVLMSLAGYSLQVNGKDQIVQWYDPVDVDLWIDNAIKSISSLVREYHLDGVDIDYESMNSTDSRLFPFCMGEVIKYLKRNRVISVATIAPYGDSAPEYRRLLRYYGDQFDYVNFQFYSFSTVTNSSAYVDLYHTIAQGFDREKLLLSVEVDGKVAARGIRSVEFFKALETLQVEHRIPGMFLWSAEGSMENGFLFEKVADCKLR